jgi:hypothetical protein
MFRRVLALSIGLLASSIATAASTLTTDASDLWYASPAESEAGWGVNVTQQADTLFITMFVYGAGSQPTWFVSSEASYAGSSGDTAIFNGPLYSTSGSPFGTPWTGKSKAHREVGAVTFALTSPTTATLSYTVDGTRVDKELVRQTFRYNDLSGQYIGAVAGTFSRCTNTATNGFTTEYATIAIVHHATSFSMTLENFEGKGSCSYNGTYSQSGQIGAASGKYTCSGGVAGTFKATELTGSATGVMGKLQESGNICSYTGRVGGVRSTP